MPPVAKKCPDPKADIVIEFFVLVRDDIGRTRVKLPYITHVFSVQAKTVGVVVDMPVPHFNRSRGNARHREIIAYLNYYGPGAYVEIKRVRGKYITEVQLVDYTIDEQKQHHSHLGEGAFINMKRTLKTNEKPQGVDVWAVVLELINTLPEDIRSKWFKVLERV